MNNVKVQIIFHVCQAAGGSGDPGVSAVGRVVTRAPGRGTGDVSREAAPPQQTSAQAIVVMLKRTKAAFYHNVQVTF